MALYIGNDKYVPMIGNTRGKFMWGDGLPISYHGLPISYQRLEYFTNEVGSFIDTGITPADIKNEPTITAKFQMITIGDKDWFGTESALGHLIYNVRSTDGFSYIRWGRVSSNSYFLPPLSGKLMFVNEPHTVKLYGTDNLYIDLDGVFLSKQSTSYNPDFNTSQHIFIGKARSANASSSKWYSFTISDGDAVKFNGIPCIRKADNAVGMYDFVTKTFFTNQGTGSFVAGLAVN